MSWPAFAAIAAVLGVLGSSKRSGSPGGSDPAAGEEAPRVGLAPAGRTDLWPVGATNSGDLEAELLQAGPVDLADIEADEPTVGCLYQTKRGETLIGEGPKSIVWRALYSAAEEAARDAGANDEDAHAFARMIAGNPNKRIQYANLITAGCIFNDLYFATWGYEPRDFVGVHGRALCLRPIHADIRGALEAGVQPRRTLAMGSPTDAKTGAAIAETRRVHPSATERPLLWLPMLNLRLLWLERQITTQGCIYEGTSIPCQEPPPEVLRLIGVRV